MIKNFWDNKRAGEESKTPKAGNIFYSPFKVASPMQLGCKNEKIVENKEKVLNKSLNFSGFIKETGLMPEDCSRTERIVEFKDDKGLEKRKTAGFEARTREKRVDRTDLNQIPINKPTAVHKKNSLSFSYNFNDLLKLKPSHSAQCSQERLKNNAKEIQKNSKVPIQKIPKILNLTEPEEFLSFLKTLNKSIKLKIPSNKSSLKQELQKFYNSIKDQQKAKKSFFHYFGKFLNNLVRSAEKTYLSVESFAVKYEKPVVFLQSIGLGIQVQESISVTGIEKDLSALEKLQESVKSLEMQNSELQLAVEKHKSEYFSILDKQKSLIDSIKYLQSNISLLREENILLETELKSSKTTIESLSNSYHSASHKNINLKKKIAELIKIIKDFQKQEYQSKPIPSTKIVSEACETNKEISQIRENLEILQIECRRLSNENQELKLMAEKTKQELKKSVDQGMRLERENALLADEAKDLTKKLSEVRSEKLKTENCFEKMQESFNEMRIENLAYKETVEILEKHCKLDSL